jgi:ribosomal protein S18 acetylase RimI-like enzyme
VTTWGARTWSVHPEYAGSAEATLLRRAYYADVAGRYWRRPATEAEVDAGTANDLAAGLAPPTGQFFVGRYGGRAAACGGLRLLEGGGRAELTRVYVSAWARSTGGGGALLAALETAALELGARELVLDTRLDLVEARGLYVKHGFREIPAYNSGRYREVWYDKSLRSV